MTLIQRSTPTCIISLTWPHCDFCGMFIDNLDFVCKPIPLHNSDSSIRHGVEDLQVEEIEAQEEMLFSTDAICCGTWLIWRQYLCSEICNKLAWSCHTLVVLFET